MARDKFHYAVRQGLEKEGWDITHDPLRLEFGENDRVEIDLGAQAILGAQRTGEKIAVEIKSFLSDSALLDFHLALGEFLNYRLVLEEIEPERILYLAVPFAAYESFFWRDLPRLAIEKYQVKLLVYEPQKRGYLAMEKLTKYRQAIQTLLSEYAEGGILGGEIESETVFDVVSDRYLLVDLGWKGQRRIYACLIHLEIREGKIWIQRNQTDRSLTEDLLARDVVKEDIVLGLQPPEVRQYTGLGIG